MLIMKNITRIFENRKNPVMALDEVSLKVNKGDMISIMGPSGSGKSTLLHIIGCLDYPSEGTYLIDDMDVTTLTDRERANIRNKKFGFILQNFALIEEETVLENITIPLMFGNCNLFKVDDEAIKILEILGMESYANKRVKNLSGGEKQRIAIARALINEPDIILADEPTGSLDSKNTQMIMDFLMKLNQEGKTIIIITHDPMVAECCTLKYHMLDGKIYERKHEF